MKSTESIDETAASTGRSLADGEAVSPSQTPLMDQRRRRLVRGAMAVAPLVLTLRSGALAAASCTGVKIAEVNVRSGATRTGELQVAASALAAGDVCVQQGVLQACPAPSTEKVLTSSPITVANSEPIAFQNISGPNDYWTCGNSLQFQGQKVAILSSASVASMGVAG